MFLVPMDTPGIEITPVDTMGGERTNITFYSDVRVPDSCRVGEVDDGWSVMHAALVYERNSANWGEPNHLVEAMAALGHAPRGPTAAAPSTTRPCGRCWPAGRPSSRSGGCCCTGRPGWRRRAPCRRWRGRWPSSTSPRRSCGASAELLDLLGPAGLAPHGRGRHGARRPGRARVPSRSRHDDLRRVQRGPAGDHRRPGPRTAPEPLRAPTFLDSGQTGDPTHRVTRVCQKSHR